MRRIWPTSPSRHATSLSTPPPKRPPSPPTTCPIPGPLPSVRKPPRVQVLIKLGGSALTTKNAPQTLHAPRFQRAMDAIAHLHRRNLGFILVHGAGSFGHFEASHHLVQGGTATPMGMSATHAAVVRLNGLVVDALLKRDVPAVGVSPLLVPAKIRNDFVAALLDRGHLPVLHGDACYVGDGRTAILSGDALILSLSSAFQFVERVVFLSDVPGVLARPPDGAPSQHEAEPDFDALVRHVTVTDGGDVNFGADVHTSCLPHDVTGGITSKIAAAGRCVAESRGRITAYIAGVGSEAALQAIEGRCTSAQWDDMPKCTRISYQMHHTTTISTSVSDALPDRSRRRLWPSSKSTT